MARNAKACDKREVFADGSALVTYADGTQMVLEGDLAKGGALRENPGINYHSSVVT